MKTVDELIAQAKVGQKNAYAPFSNFHVGAALLLKDDNIIIGGNIENSSYGLTNCAERSALFACYSLGYRKDDIVAMAIVSDFTGPTSPCGACRQVMIDLINKDVPVYLVNANDTVVKTTVAELLPLAFDGDSMK